MLDIRNVRSFSYQLQGLDVPGAVEALAATRYDLIVADPVSSVAGSEGFDTRAMVAKLHASTGASGQPKLVLAYLNAGEAEDYRGYWKPEWATSPPSFILGQDPDGWHGDHVVKFWDSQWQSLALASIAFDARAGYDGAYLDWVQGYADPLVMAAAAKDGVDPKAELITFVTALRDTARAVNPGFMLVAQNAAELVRDPNYLSLFSGIGQEDLSFAGSGSTPNTVPGDVPRSGSEQASLLLDLDAWKAAGKAVLTIDYATTPENVAAAYSLSSAHGFAPYVSTQLLDRLSTTPPPAEHFSAPPNTGITRGAEVSAVDVTVDRNFTYDLTGDVYVGPVSYLTSQYIYAGSDDMVLAARTDSVFLKGGAGNYALNARGGSNVLDGGLGSNFLVGAMGTDGGTDTFYCDGRGPGSTWDSVMNFHAGDAVTLWGYVAGTSTMTWAASEGAAGYTGATLHVAGGGAGTPVNMSVTFVGVSLADAQSQFSQLSGTVEGNPFLYLHNGLQ